MKSSSPARRPQADRRRDAQRNLTAAVVKCLDKMGYAQTSITAVQEAAGVSRGAVLHHFPNKLALITATAKTVLATAFDRGIRRGPPPEGTDLEQLVIHHWRTVVDTPAGRAYLEILGACRTDAELRQAIQQVIAEWEAGLTSTALERFLGHPLRIDEEDVGALWGVCRAFLRGLLLDMPQDPSLTERRVLLFARMLKQYLAHERQPKELG